MKSMFLGTEDIVELQIRWLVSVQLRDLLHANKLKYNCKLVEQLNYSRIQDDLDNLQKDKKLIKN